MLMKLCPIFKYYVALYETNSVLSLFMPVFVVRFTHDLSQLSGCKRAWMVCSTRWFKYDRD
jgi:hypothetical protein